MTRSLHYEPELQVPDGYVSGDEYRDQIYEVAEDQLRTLSAALGTYGPGLPRVDSEDLTDDDANVELRLPVQPPAARQWRNGCDVYYQWDAADYDVRPDLVAQLLRCVEILKRDIQERPL